jgi:hypothetical protein
MRMVCWHRKSVASILASMMCLSLLHPALFIKAATAQEQVDACWFPNGGRFATQILPDALAENQCLHARRQRFLKRATTSNVNALSSLKAIQSLLISATMISRSASLRMAVKTNATTVGSLKLKNV